jgi:hypothetical protein
MCKWGTDRMVRLSFPNDISGKTECMVDYCISPLVQALNDFGFQTVGSCCGHGKNPASIIFRCCDKNIEITGKHFPTPTQTDLPSAGNVDKGEPHDNRSGRKGKSRSIQNHR